MTFKQYLIEVDACEEARLWNGNKTLSECWQECKRGEWMLWLLCRSGSCDIKTLTLAKAKCASLVSDKMVDERSIEALNAAFSFAIGGMSEMDLLSHSFLAFTAYSLHYDGIIWRNYAAAAAYFATLDGLANSAASAATSVAHCEYGHKGLYHEITLAKCADICREVVPVMYIDGVSE